MSKAKPTFVWVEERRDYLKAQRAKATTTEQEIRHGVRITELDRVLDYMRSHGEATDLNKAGQP